MRAEFVALIFAFGVIATAKEKRLNNFVSEWVNSASVTLFVFDRPYGGWIFLATPDGAILDDQAIAEGEYLLYVSKGFHSVRVKSSESGRRLIIRSIPELMHSGLGFDPQIKSYGKYDLEFLKKDILPNITTLIVPSNLQPGESAVQARHSQGKKFVAEVGINSQAKSAEEHAKYWASFCEKSPFLDGIIINELIVNRPVVEWAELTPERLARMDAERKDYQLYNEGIQKLRENAAFKEKMLYVYVGGSGKKLNQEIIGTNIVRTIINSGYRIAPERYLHEMSSEKGSREALDLFIEGLADWEAKEPGVKQQMVITFGLFSMPPGGINKQPNVDYHVWMDQQMNVVANHPSFAGIAGLNWWTSLLADEETVRFVGRLYRHYAIEGKTNMLTHDPLFPHHIENADFEHGTNDWTLQSATEGSIAAKSFPRYGRIEGRFMGLGRPADPEHIGDTFLWMKRNEKGANSFSQTIKNLEPGRLYSMKMFTCDYNDLVNPKEKKQEEANRFIGSIVLEGVEIDSKRSFHEMYSSSPEPKIPVWITYHWKVFRAKSTTAKLTVSDWETDSNSVVGFGQEQTFNFLEIQPYHE